MLHLILINATYLAIMKCVKGLDEMNHIYLCIDLKTFYASVECVERHLDPFETNLVVADPSRGNGALCLAISPKMKAQGIKNRCRIFEIPKDISYITAVPRMKLYMEYAARIYGIYLKYVSKDDIHVYSIDEAFMDITPYLKLYHKKPREIAQMILDDIYATTGITATVGIGTNLYLAKVALDIISKHVPDHVGCLTEQMYQKYLWHHQPLTDFWQIGRGIANRLAKYGIVDMYGVAHCPEQILYQEFGINAAYLIDHSEGIEPTTIADIKRYRSRANSISNSQILFEDYAYEDALLVLKEMVELNVLRLVEHHLVTDHLSLYVGYSKDIVRSTGGSIKIGVRTNSYKILLEEFMQLFKRTTNPGAPIRKIAIGFGDVLDEYYETYNLFTDYEELDKERRIQEAIITIKDKYGKNAILKGMNLLEHATTVKRNTLVGGHNAE